MRALLDDDSSDAVLALHCPVAVADPTEAAAAVVEAVREQDGVRQKPVFTAWVCAHAVVEGRRLFDRSGLPHYATPDQAVRAFMHLVRYRRNKALPMLLPPSARVAAAPDTQSVRSLIASHLGEGRDVLNTDHAKHGRAPH